MLAVGAAALLAGCGGSSKPAATTTAGPKIPPVLAAFEHLASSNAKLDGTATILFQQTHWAVVSVRKGDAVTAVAFRKANGTWVADRTNAVKVTILGPQPGRSAPKQPQIAAGIATKTPIIETGLWLDGVALVQKAGGSSTSATTYGAPTAAVKAGVHVAIAYARTGTNATAVAWTFKTA